MLSEEKKDEFQDEFFEGTVMLTCPCCQRKGHYTLELSKPTLLVCGNGGKDTDGCRRYFVAHQQVEVTLTTYALQAVQKGAA